VDLRSAGLSNSASAGQRLRKKWQALVHPVIDAERVVGELLVAMPDPKLIQPSYEPTGAVEQVELVLFAAIDVEGFQPARLSAWLSIAVTGSCRDQFAQRSSTSSYVSIVTGSLTPRNCVGPGS
jgi:hypothetical protein